MAAFAMTNGESNGRTRGYNLAARTGRMCGDEPHARSGGAKPRLNMVIALAVLFLCVTAFSQTQSQTRDQLLQDIGSGQLKEAIVLGQQAVSRWPRDPQFRHYLGVAYFKTGDLKQAEDQLARARDLDGKDASTRFDLALVFLSQDDYVKAAVELEASNKLSPSNALGHILLGRAYLNSNRSLQAIDEFKTALKLDPSVRLGHYHLGFAYASLGRDEEAIAEYKEELRRSGRVAGSRVRIGTLAP
jgi:tetratricopeptide (TPR) repeat protein